MVVTRRGVAGVFAAGHVTGEIRLAIVHAPILYQHSEDETATNWETLSSEEDATHKAAQVKLSYSNELRIKSPQQEKKQSRKGFIW